MIPLEFKEFIAAGKDDGHLGLVKVKWNGIILIYKIATNKKTNVPFAAASSYKTLDPITLEEKYISAFKIDSGDEDDRVRGFALSHAKVNLALTSVKNLNTPSNQPMFPGQSALPMTYPEPVQQQEFQGSLPF